LTVVSLTAQTITGVRLEPKLTLIGDIRGDVLTSEPLTGVVITVNGLESGNWLSGNWASGVIVPAPVLVVGVAVVGVVVVVVGGPVSPTLVVVMFKDPGPRPLPTNPTRRAAMFGACCTGRPNAWKAANPTRGDAPVVVDAILAFETKAADLPLEENTTKAGGSPPILLAADDARAAWLRAMATWCLCMACALMPPRSSLAPLWTA
jgi:hypothetical protein